MFAGSAAAEEHRSSRGWYAATLLWKSIGPRCAATLLPPPRRGGGGFVRTGQAVLRLPGRRLRPAGTWSARSSPWRTGCGPRQPGRPRSGGTACPRRWLRSLDQCVRPLGGSGGRRFGGRWRLGRTRGEGSLVAGAGGGGGPAGLVGISLVGVEVGDARHPPLAQPAAGQPSHPLRQRLHLDEVGPERRQRCRHHSLRQRSRFFKTDDTTTLEQSRSGAETRRLLVRRCCGWGHRRAGRGGAEWRCRELLEQAPRPRRG